MFRKRRWLLNLLTLCSFLLIALIALVVLLKQEPRIYKDTVMPAGFLRETRSREMMQLMNDAGNYIRNEPRWYVSFANEQMNSFLQGDDFDTYLGGDSRLPDGFTDPRIFVENNRLRLAIRYGKGVFSTILSLDLRLWIIPSEINRIGMEVISLKAGAVPLSPAMVLDYISEAVRKNNIEITWYRDKNHPVAVMRLQSENNFPTFQLDRLELNDGNLTIGGRKINFVEVQPE
ncbi:MAG: hypothetical protein R3B84_02965 [Zavarzinella sp.]